MKTQREGTVQDPVTLGASFPLPQARLHFQPRGRTKGPSAARLQPSQGGAENLHSWTSHPYRHGWAPHPETLGQKSPNNHYSISPQDTLSLLRGPSCMASSLLPVKPTYKRAGSGPATVLPSSATASAQRSIYNQLKTRPFPN